MQTFENLLQNYLTEILDIVHKNPWFCLIKVCSNGGAACIIVEIIAKDNSNVILNLFHNFKLPFATKIIIV